MHPLFYMLDFEKYLWYVFVLERSVNTMTTLEDLYYGNIHPNERFTGQSPRTDNLVKLIGKNEDELKESLTEKQKEVFEKFKDCQNELSLITEQQAFRTGYILATRIMVEVMDGLQEVEDI